MRALKKVSFGTLLHRIQKPHLLFRFRERYLKNKHGRIRLRYIAPVLVPCLLFLAVSLASTAVSALSKADWTVAQIQVEDALIVSNLSDDDFMLSALPDSVIPETTTRTPNVKQFYKAAALPKAKPLPELEPKEDIIKISKGGTLSGALSKAGFSASESYKIVEALKDAYDPRDLRAGQKIHLHYEPFGDIHKFTEMVIHKNPVEYVSLKASDEGQYSAEQKERDVRTRTYAKYAEIETSLYGSSARSGIPDSVIAEIIHMYSWDVDFQRDIRSGDRVEVLYEQIETPDGIKVSNGNILYARLDVNGQDIPVYRFEMENGDVDYFTPNGHSVRKALMKTPVDGARLSSGFGMRKHPILGYNKMHKGTDFAAPTGTPIYAAGDGTLEYVGRKGAYGNYMRIRHNSELKTAYAHLHKFAKGMSRGKRVKQGQVIGYIGSTGRSTGPHLHYEILKNNVQVNPRTVKLPQGEVLRGAQLAKFKDHMSALNNQYASLSGNLKYASR